MADVKFSQFTDGDQCTVGDIVVGLRGGVNYRFDFPSTGFKDASGNFLLQYATAGGASVNYPKLTNSLTNTAIIYGADGTDANIKISIEPKGSGNIVLDGLNWPISDGSANTVLYTNGAGQLGWTTAAFPITVGAAGTIIRSNGTNWVASTSTFADTYAINTILYNASANTVSGLAATARGVLVSDNSSVPSMLASASTTGQVLQGSTTGTPTWSTPTYPSASGTVGKIIRSDGTNNVYTTSTFPDTFSINTIPFASSANVIGAIAAANGGVLISSSTGVPSMLANPSATGKLLSSVSGDASVWTTPTYPVASGSAGKIIRSDGTNNVYTTSTFADTYAVSTILYASGANAVSGLATANSAVLVTGATGVPVMSGTMTDGQVIIGSTGATPTAATLTAGTGISITNAAGSITIDATGGGFAVATISGTTQSAAVNTMYIALNSGQTTVTLPSTYAVGQSVVLVGSTANTGGWILT